MDYLIDLQSKLLAIKNMGWIENRRPGNAGGVGNTLEDLLSVRENNLSLPDYGNWELKAQRKSTSSLLTLFHFEPNPRSGKIVPKLLIPCYGWQHQAAGTMYPETEKSFRQTITATTFSDRGFTVVVDRMNRKLLITFDRSKVSNVHDEWLLNVARKIGLNNLLPQPYWTFEEIDAKLKSKLKNLMYIKADTKKEGTKEYFKYTNFEAYMNPTLENFISLIEEGYIYVDFDARTGHNHGTKFRITPAKKELLYSDIIKI